MQSFRASPWVSYEPSLLSQERDQPVSGSDVDEDVDMDAPRISTLGDEDSPPHHPNKKISKKRPHKATLLGGAGKEADEFDEEEDQLIDELIDDDDSAKLSPSARSIDTAQKRKTSVKRKSRKGEKKPSELDKKKATAAAPAIVPTISIFKANPTTALEDSASSALTAPAGSAPKAKKKVSPRKPAVPRAMGRSTKAKSIPSHLFPVEDAGVLSESYAGTAASSPVTAVFEQNSPEPENLQPSSPFPSSAAMVDDPPNFESVPIPVYPLPTKPFPVQPPPKIPTGFAPLIAIDRTRTGVRHWREAKREIRGIAGGRWLAKTWVGDKEFVTYATKAVDDKVSTSKIPVKSKVVSKLKASSKGGSVANSANPSRAASVVPEHSGNPVISAVRAPTKMRISQKAPSDESAAATPSGA